MLLKRNITWKITQFINRPAPFPFILSGATHSLGSRDEGGKGGGMGLPISYRNSFPQDLSPNFGLERVFHDQIHFDSKQIGQVIFDCKKCQQTGHFLERDQNIQVTVLLLL